VLQKENRAGSPGFFSRRLDAVTSRAAHAGAEGASGPVEGQICSDATPHASEKSEEHYKQGILRASLFPLCHAMRYLMEILLTDRQIIS
jgi:hypothetical protein